MKYHEFFHQRKTDNYRVIYGDKVYDQTSRGATNSAPSFPPPLKKKPMSVVKDAATPELARGSVLKPQDLVYLDGGNYKRNIQCRISDQVIDTTCGGFIYPGGYSGVWTSCLGDSVNRRNFDTLYLHFPSSYRTAEEIERFAAFMVKHFNLHIRYVGEIYLDAYRYYSKGMGNDQMRVHMVALDRQPDFYDLAANTILTKVTLVRYLYRTDHYAKIILPLYDMVEESGMNPWDALILSHYHGFALNVKNYAGGRGLLFDDEGITLMYPRSYEKFLEYFKKYQFVNNVFSPKYLRNEDFLNPHLHELLIESSDFYNDYGLRNVRQIFRDKFEFVMNPHASVFKEEFYSLLKKKEWRLAFELYVTFIQEIAPILKLYIKDIDKFTKMNRALNTNHGNSHINFIVDLLAFQESFK